MKYLIFSDLHGSSKSAQTIIDNFLSHHCDELICLGDVLYHGPRNDLPDFYEPKKVIQILNEYADKITCITGNCDAEVDQMVLKFNLIKEKDLLLNGLKFHLEHGHHLDEKKYFAPYILYGHTHISTYEVRNGHTYINPGSITIPKENTEQSFLILDEKELTLYDKDNKILKHWLLS